MALTGAELFLAFMDPETGILPESAWLEDALCEGSAGIDGSINFENLAAWVRDRALERED